eukprot:30856-Pelagococcus_subviridis.AAC.5
MRAVSRAALLSRGVTRPVRRTGRRARSRARAGRYRWRRERPSLRLLAVAVDRNFLRLDDVLVLVHGALVDGRDGRVRAREPPFNPHSVVRAHLTARVANLLLEQPSHALLVIPREHVLASRGARSHGAVSARVRRVSRPRAVHAGAVLAANLLRPGAVAAAVAAAVAPAVVAAAASGAVPVREPARVTPRSRRKVHRRRHAVWIVRPLRVHPVRDARAVRRIEPAGAPRPRPDAAVVVVVVVVRVQRRRRVPDRLPAAVRRSVQPRLARRVLKRPGLLRRQRDEVVVRAPGAVAAAVVARALVAVQLAAGSGRRRRAPRAGVAAAAAANHLAARRRPARQRLRRLIRVRRRVRERGDRVPAHRRHPHPGAARPADAEPGRVAVSRRRAEPAAAAAARAFARRGG